MYLKMESNIFEAYLKPTIEIVRRVIYLFYGCVAKNIMNFDLKVINKIVCDIRSYRTQKSRSSPTPIPKRL